MDKKITVEEALTSGSAFCVMPWIHFSSTPKKRITACCVNGLRATYDGGDFQDTANLPELKQLRVDMLNGKKHESCNICYNIEEYGGSPRTDFNRGFITEYNNGQPFLDELMSKTHEDGYIEDFQMQLLDLRYSNVCNLKCRSCGSDYSSLWEAEHKKHGQHDLIPTVQLDSYNDIERQYILHDSIQSIPHLKEAYFAGGEPLMYDEHYVLLQEMIDQGRTDIKLRYNTNGTILTFKGHDLFKYWEQFDSHVIMTVSIDEQGERAEYVRSGTKWPVVEQNLRAYASRPDIINFNYGSVISVYNVMTFPQMIRDFHQRGLLSERTSFQVILCTNPDYFALSLFPSYARPAVIAEYQSMFDYVDQHNLNPDIKRGLENIISYLRDAPCTWDKHGKDFWTMTYHLDGIRNEKFEDIFPELAEILKNA